MPAFAAVTVSPELPARVAGGVIESARQFSQPTSADDAWEPSWLEYQFAASAPLPAPSERPITLERMGDVYSAVPRAVIAERLWGTEERE